MKRISEILFYTKNYRLNVVLNVFFHLLTSVFSLFSFAAIAPFLAILFKTTKQVTVVKPAEFTLTTGSILDNMNYFLSSFIAEHGEEGALMLLCFVLVFMYLLKNTTNYLAMFHIARVRAGVVKVLREKIYTKILALPLSFFTNERKGDILTKSTSDVTEVEISIAQATLGVSLELATLDGDETLVIPAGTQPGREFMLRRRGVPRLQASGRGDLRVIIKVVVPSKLTDDEVEVLRLFAQQRGEEVAPADKSLFSKIKSAFS